MSKKKSKKAMKFPIDEYSIIAANNPREDTIPPMGFKEGVIREEEAAAFNEPQSPIHQNDNAGSKPSDDSRWLASED